LLVGKSYILSMIYMLKFILVSYIIFDFNIQICHGEIITGESTTTIKPTNTTAGEWIDHKNDIGAHIWGSWKNPYDGDGRFFDHCKVEIFAGNIIFGEADVTFHCSTLKMVSANGDEGSLSVNALGFGIRYYQYYAGIYQDYGKKVRERRHSHIEIHGGGLNAVIFVNLLPLQGWALYCVYKDNDGDNFVREKCGEMSPTFFGFGFGLSFGYELYFFNIKDEVIYDTRSGICTTGPENKACHNGTSIGIIHQGIDYCECKCYDNYQGKYCSITINPPEIGTQDKQTNSGTSELRRGLEAPPRKN